MVMASEEMDLARLGNERKSEFLGITSIMVPLREAIMWWQGKGSDKAESEKR